MIHFDPPPEPDDFDEKVRQPERKWPAEHPEARRLYPYWGGCREQLADGFGGLCAYTAMYEPVGTVDHFLCVDPADDDPSERERRRNLAYEWTNYRFSAQWVNSSKQNAEVLDPFLVEDDWFELSLPDLQLRVTDAVPERYRELAAYTLLRLHLRDDERVLRQRRVWYELYRSGKLPLSELHHKAPLIARAVERAISASP